MLSRSEKNKINKIKYTEDYIKLNNDKIISTYEIQRIEEKILKDKLKNNIEVKITYQWNYKYFCKKLINKLNYQRNKSKEKKINYIGSYVGRQQYNQNTYIYLKSDLIEFCKTNNINEYIKYFK